MEVNLGLLHYVVSNKTYVFRVFAQLFGQIFNQHLLIYKAGFSPVWIFSQFLLIFHFCDLGDFHAAIWTVVSTTTMA